MQNGVALTLPSAIAQLRGRLDLNRLAVAGHSFGAATACLTAFRDEQQRFRAVICMDPWRLPLPMDFMQQGLRVPILFHISDDFRNTDYVEEARYRRAALGGMGAASARAWDPEQRIVCPTEGAWESVRVNTSVELMDALKEVAPAPSLFYTLKTSQHISFGDAPIFSERLHALVKPHEIGGADGLAIINGLNRSFLARVFGSGDEAATMWDPQHLDARIVIEHDPARGVDPLSSVVAAAPAVVDVHAIRIE